MNNHTSDPPSESDEAIEECLYCETTLSGDDPTYRVLYGRFEHVKDNIISEKLIAEPGEELDPGADEQYYCLDCYKKHYDRENGAHFEFESAEELWSILEAANGRLVADTLPLTIGGRGWVRVVDGDVQARHAVRVTTGEDGDHDIAFDSEPSPDFDRDNFNDLFDGSRDMRLIVLKPVDETPFVAGMNRTLGIDYSE